MPSFTAPCPGCGTVLRINTNPGHLIQCPMCNRYLKAEHAAGMGGGEGGDWWAYSTMLLLGIVTGWASLAGIAALAGYKLLKG